MSKTSRGRLSGETAVITGGAAGIGRATSLMFACEGARVIIIVKPPHETTEQDYDRLMDINVRSAFLVCRSFARNGFKRWRFGRRHSLNRVRTRVRS